MVFWRICLENGGAIWLLLLAVELLGLGLWLQRRVHRLDDPLLSANRGPLRCFLGLLVGVWMLKNIRGLLYYHAFGVRGPVAVTVLILVYGYFLYWAVRTLILAPGLRQGGIVSAARLPHPWEDVQSVKQIGTYSICFYLKSGRSCVLRTQSTEAAKTMLETAEEILKPEHVDN